MTAHSVISHAALGEVRLVVRSAARRFIARWQGGRVVLTVPSGAGVADILAALDSLAPRLLRRKPAAGLFAEGVVTEQPGLRVELRRDSLQSSSIRATGRCDDAVITVGRGCDLESPAVMRAITAVLMRIARERARTVLPPQVLSIAADFGLRPGAISISRGLHTLGRCSASGSISLSAALMFLPEHLRRYIICHELAHLTEMNHSPRFHALCDAYCSGRETLLAAELSRFRWPLLR